MPGEVILETNEDLLAHLTLEDGRASRDLGVAQLVLASLRPAAPSVLALAPLAESFQDVPTIAHKARLLHDRLAALGLLSHLALVAGDPGNALEL